MQRRRKTNKCIEIRVEIAKKQQVVCRKSSYRSKLYISTYKSKK